MFQDKKRKKKKTTWALTSGKGLLGGGLLFLRAKQSFLKTFIKNCHSPSSHLWQSPAIHWQYPLCHVTGIIDFFCFIQPRAQNKSLNNFSGHSSRYCWALTASLALFRHSYAPACLCAASHFKLGRQQGAAYWCLPSSGDSRHQKTRQNLRSGAVRQTAKLHLPPSWIWSQIQLFYCLWCQWGIPEVRRWWHLGSAWEVAGAVVPSPGCQTAGPPALSARVE